MDGGARFTQAGGIGIARQIYAGGIVVASDTTDSADTITGSLLTAGGLGVAKKAYFGSEVVGTATTASTSSVAGAFMLAGGLSAAAQASILLSRVACKCS